MGTLVAVPDAEVVTPTRSGEIRNCRTYRIPGLIRTKSGALLGCFDARYENHLDLSADIDVAVLIFANWLVLENQDGSIWQQIYANRWYAVAFAAMALCWALLVCLNIPTWKVVASATAVVGALVVSMLWVQTPIFEPYIPMLVALAALALQLAGSSLSLPNMLVISGGLGWRKTAIYVTLVVALSTVCGFIYGNQL